MSNTIDSSVLDSVNAGSSASGGLGGTTGGGIEDISDSFMTLLVAQLENQDPMNPMENAEMTSQMAQINTVQGINDLNSSLEDINSQIDEGHTLQAASLIDQGVLVPADHVLVSEGSTTPFGIELDSPAEEVTATITNGNGEAVRSFDVGSLDEGVESFTWDGTLENGETAPDGTYNVSIEATQDGESVAHETLGYARVSGVAEGENGPLLDLGGALDLGQVGMADIRQILN
ncbi:flagellar hook assembly protein FlgD [Aidingimonas halophila]|uniref:Basal-body rod modification protein FlgD n=1 Tax=Aidingimonas halophila TaxID=574349 RepID=A0A1H3B7K7_9GAMM|nr:flagellar hook assembly protein FlgD [Aidingimonas halophila]GHC26050.1 basal-body rod modification protein FlgD [Aidingimonas halophila]SDX37927.1 flagellar basal-body rod modification protein FlgD [Aidingimonas halophila]